MSTFINDVLQMKVSLSQIDDYIDKWHEGRSDLSLHEFLGIFLIY